MAVQAYVLIRPGLARAPTWPERSRGSKGVISAADATGPYDVIAKVEAETMDTLGELVVFSLLLVDGVVRTLTCPIVNL